MESEELIKLMETIDAKGIGWDKVQQETKVPYATLEALCQFRPGPCDHHQETQDLRGRPGQVNSPEAKRPRLGFSQSWVAAMGRR